MVLAARPLTIGPIAIRPAVVLAPMAGITNVAFRQLCREYGGGLFISEMQSAHSIVAGKRVPGRLLFGRDEAVRSVQLYGVEPAVVAEATKRLIGEYDVTHVDLNMGCPAPKVMRLGGGAALPVRRVLFARLVAAAVDAAGAIPVTVKMRTGLDDDTLTYLEAGRSAESAGAAALMLHARTAEQHYAGQADWSAIARLKEAVQTIPVLGNGDIWEAADALRMMASTGCDGVVVGRGCLGRPWLFRDLAAVFAGEPVPPAPTFGEVASIMRRHARMLVDSKQSEQLGVRDFRKHTGWYVTGYPVAANVTKQLGQVTTLSEVARLLDRADAAATLQEGGERLPRGHTSGPLPVVVPDGWRDSVDDPTAPAGAELLVSGG